MGLELVSPACQISRNMQTLLHLAATCLLGFNILVSGTEMTLQEGKAIYNTSIEYDPLTADVITYVPYHQRDGLEFLESTKIENIYLGVSVWRESGDNFCYHRTLKEYESPILLSRIVDSVSANNLVVDSKQMKQVLVWATPDTEMSEEERVELSKDMKQLCVGVRIIKMATKQVSSEQFEELVEEASECYPSQSGLHRGKRSLKLAQRVCTSCARHRVIRQKRSVGSSGNDLGVGNLVHLIIGHKQIDCQ